MGSITKVEWRFWKGNQKKVDRAYFKDKASADKFSSGLGKEKNVIEVEIIEGLSLADVK